MRSSSSSPGTTRNAVGAGTVVIEEPAVHHQEGRSDTTANERTRFIFEGHGFHHLPLVGRTTISTRGPGEKKRAPYGYSARIADDYNLYWPDDPLAGCATLLLIPAADYTSILKAPVEREMRETVRGSRK